MWTSGLPTHREEVLVKYIDKFLNEVDNDTSHQEFARGDYRLYDEFLFDPDGWLTALRDGSHKQASGYLCVIDDAVIDQTTGEITAIDCSYCCLGVLLDVTSNGWMDTSDAILWENENEIDEDTLVVGGNRWYASEQMYNVFDDGQATLIDNQYASEMGLFDIAQTVLSGLNDAGATFEEIAIVIEANDCRAVSKIADKIRGIE